MAHPWLTSVRDDIYGGLVSAAVAIPLAMGFGMFAFASLGENYFADGAMAGLITAFVVGVICILLGDKTTTVFAPRINSTFFLGILLYGLVHSDAEIIKDGGVPLALAILFSVILLGGVFQTVFGLIGIGTLIRFADRHKGKPLKRGVLFAAFTGEEKGLLGARWFVDHPTVSKASLVALSFFR